MLRIVAALGYLAAVAGCSDPYEHYATAVHQDVDAAMRDAFQMTARLQLTVVHNRIPDDSIPIVARTVTQTARQVRKRAVHFANESPPADLVTAHAALSTELTTLARALDELGAAFQSCAATECQARIDSVSTQFQFVGEDLSTSRGAVQRMLLRHGVMLRP